MEWYGVFPSIAKLLSAPVNTVLLIINRLKQLGLIHGYVDRETGDFKELGKEINYYSEIIDFDFKDYKFCSAKVTPNETRRILNILSDVREDIPITSERIHEMTGFTKRRIKSISSYVLREGLIDGEYLPTEGVFIKSKSTERKKTYVDNVEQNQVILDLLCNVIRAILPYSFFGVCNSMELKSWSYLGMKSQGNNLSE